MRIFVCCEDGKLRLVHADPFDAVQHVLGLLPPLVNSEFLEVTHNGIILDKTKSLAFYKLQEDDVLYGQGWRRRKGSQERKRFKKQLVEMVEKDEEQMLASAMGESSATEPAEEASAAERAEEASAAEPAMEESYNKDCYNRWPFEEGGNSAAAGSSLAAPPAAAAAEGSSPEASPAEEDEDSEARPRRRRFFRPSSKSAGK